MFSWLQIVYDETNSKIDSTKKTSVQRLMTT
jgi:hypothetical protein